MLYAINVNSDGLDIVDSKTLIRSKLTYDELYSIISDGIEVHCICCTSPVYTINGDRVNLDKDSLKNIKHLTYGGKIYSEEDTYLYCKDEIPISYSREFDLDLSVTLDDIVIVKYNNLYYIWYDGFYYKTTKTRFKSCYRYDNVIIFEFISTSGFCSGMADIILGNTEFTSLGEKCTRSEFKRMILTL